MKTIRIQVGKDMEQILGALKKRYPLLGNVEIIKLSLSDFYHEEHRQPLGGAMGGYRRTLEQLPELDLTDEERDAVTAAVDEAERDQGVILSAEEAMGCAPASRKNR